MPRARNGLPLACPRADPAKLFIQGDSWLFNTILYWNNTLLFIQLYLILKQHASLYLVGRFILRDEWSYKFTIMFNSLLVTFSHDKLLIQYITIWYIMSNMPNVSLRVKFYIHFIFELNLKETITLTSLDPDKPFIKIQTLVTLELFNYVYF